MDTIIYVIAAAIAITTTLVALLRPAVFIAHYHRTANAIMWVGTWGFLWIMLRNASALRLILLEIEDPVNGVAPRIERISTLAAEAVGQQRTYGPAFLVLLLAGAYIQVLGKARATAAQKKAA